VCWGCTQKFRLLIITVKQCSMSLSGVQEHGTVGNQRRSIRGSGCRNSSAEHELKNSPTDTSALNTHTFLQTN